MADINDKNFQEWLKEKHIPDFTKCSDDEKARLEKEFAAFETWLAHGKENDTGKKDFADIETPKRQDVLNKFDAAFKKWAKDSRNIDDLDDLKNKNPQEFAKLCDDYAMDTGKLKARQGTRDSNPNANEWRQEKIDSWKHWCEQEHTPAYIYKEDEAEKTALTFDVYKTKEDADAGKPRTTVHYDNPRSVSLGTDDEKKAPDLEFFDKLTKEAKKDKIPGVTFEGEMTPDFKAKLAISCLKNGLKMDGFDEKIDLSLLNDAEKASIDKGLKAKIEYHNAQKEAKEFAQAHAPDKKISMKDLMGTETDPTLAAIKYTAYQQAGITVEGVEKFNENSHGMFLAVGKEHMPTEVQKTITEYNDKTSQNNIQKLRAEITTRTENKKNDPNVSAADKQKIKGLDKERQETLDARKFFSYLREKTKDNPNQSKLISRLRKAIRDGENITKSTTEDAKIGALVASFTNDDWEKMGIKSVPTNIADKINAFKGKLQKSDTTLLGRVKNRQSFGVYDTEEYTKPNGSKGHRLQVKNVNKMFNFIKQQHQR